MAAVSESMQEPVCFINSEEDGGLSVQQEALTILQKIPQPAVVVAIVGLYRTGKSYLMNRLARKQTGFALGNTVESKTKGIWMWCVPHPSKTGHTLVLLDTEGLGDVSKGDSKHDTKIFALAILLSSTLVYNSRGTIDNKTIEDLQYVTELTQYIKIRSSDDKGNDSEFVKFFPNFIWAVRDFTLQLNIGGQNVTPDGYLEDSLKLKSGCATTVMDYNLPRESIRKYFPSRRCFTFPFPTNPDNMADLENLNSDELSANFLKVTEDFCTFVYNKSQVKLLKDGHKVTGKVLGDLAQVYVESISRGDMPCLENAVVTISGIENKAAVEDGVQVYQRGMEQLKQRFPLELEAVTSEHQQLSSMATQKFMKRCFKDDEGVFIKSLESNIDQHFKKYIQNNEEVSKRTCRDLLGRLSANMTDQLQNGFYTKPGGYELYRKDMDKIVEDYNSQTHNSVKSEDVLEKFLKNMSETSDQIRQADTKLNEKEKQICEEKEKASLLEQKMAAEMEEKQKLEAIMKAEKETYEDRMKQMEEKNEEEKKQKEEEFQRALESKMTEQEIMLKKGFDEQAQKLRQEIELSKEEHSREKQELLQRYEQSLTLMKQQHEQSATHMNQNISQLVDVLKVQQQQVLAMQPLRDSTGCFNMNCKPIPCSVL